MEIVTGKFCKFTLWAKGNTKTLASWLQWGPELYRKQRLPSLPGANPASNPKPPRQPPSTLLPAPIPSSLCRQRPSVAVSQYGHMQFLQGRPLKSRFPHLTFNKIKEGSIPGPSPLT